jgi:hypothetical protein
MLGIAALLMFSLYRRYRSHVGPQLVKPRRMVLRVVLFGVFGLVFAASPMSLQARLVMVAGLAAGAALGWLSLRHTRFETRAARHYYIPNIYIGMAVSALFVLRIVWRMAVIYPQIQQQQQAGGPLAALASQKTPATMALLGLVIGYYALYYIGVLIHSNRAVAAAQPGLPAQAEGEAGKIA